MNNKRPMTWERIEELHQSYGADPIRWPEEERAAAQSLLAQNPERAATVCRVASELDQLLDNWKAPSLSSEAMASMHQEAHPPSALRLRMLLDRWIGWTGPIWQPTGVFAAALFLGVAIGGAGFDALSLIPIELADASSEAPTDLESLILDLESLVAEGELS